MLGRGAAHAWPEGILRMKKYIVSMIAVMLLVSMFCAQGFAYGDVTVRKVNAYSDEDMTELIGTIPRYTAVVVKDSADGTAYLKVNGVKCYVSASALAGRRYDYGYKGYAVLSKGSKVWQRPTASGRSVTNRKRRAVIVYAVRGEWVLVRSGFEGYFGFVRRAALSSFTPAG